MRTLIAIAVLLLSIVTAHAQQPDSDSPIQLSVNVGDGLTGDFDQLLRRRILRILVVPNRTNFFIDRGQTRGVTYEAFELVEKFINKKHKTGKLPLKVVFIPVSRDKILEALTQGRGDVAAATLTITAERKAVVDFTKPVITGESEILVAAEAAPAVLSVGELSGKEVFVRESSSYFSSLSALNKTLVASGKEPVILRLAPEDLQDEDILEMVQAGLIKYTVVDRTTANFWKQIFPKISVNPQVALRTGGEIAWMIRKNSPLLAAELNDFLAKNPPGSSDRETLLRRYLKNTSYLKNAASEAEIKKFAATVKLFKEYGERYGLDYLLVMAQGYQESRLDQKVKSRIGAVGIMQIMPATGRELKVGDIHQIEPNIHAGVKYMRFMIDRYYKDQPMDDLNRALFTFASYNAGPARIAKLRTEAASRGFDRNRWFNNVEVIVSERIGQETVRYVSNIYKYYIAYKLVSEELEKKQALQNEGIPK